MVRNRERLSVQTSVNNEKRLNTYRSNKRKHIHGWSRADNGRRYRSILDKPTKSKLMILILFWIQGKKVSNYCCP